MSAGGRLTGETVIRAVPGMPEREPAPVVPTSSVAGLAAVRWGASRAHLSTNELSTVIERG